MSVEDVKRVFRSPEVISLPNGSYVSVEAFAEQFAEAPANPTYAELTIIDAGEKGYQPFFDQCKAEGLLS